MLIAESACWGNIHRCCSRSKDDNWRLGANDILKNYFHIGVSIVMEPLKRIDVYTALGSPVFLYRGMVIKDEFIRITVGDTITLVNISGAIIAVYDEKLNIHQATILKSADQIRRGMQRTALIDFFTGVLRVTEIYYYP